MIDHTIACILPQLPTLKEIVVWGGYAGLALIVFSETGLLIGFFLPGDSLLVTAGLYAAATKSLDPFVLIPILWVAAVLGNATGYFIGHKAGQSLYDRPQSRFFRRDHLLKTREFYDRYGGITIIMAQFMPFARTFAPVVAGVAQMTYRRFALFNVVGAVAWITSMVLLGYYLGQTIPGIESKIEYVIAVIVFLSVLPIIIKYAQHRLRNRSAS
jgi:membrane-associated protein